VKDSEIKQVNLLLDSVIEYQTPSTIIDNLVELPLIVQKMKEEKKLKDGVRYFVIFEELE